MNGSHRIPTGLTSSAARDLVILGITTLVPALQDLHLNRSLGSEFLLYGKNFLFLVMRRGVRVVRATERLVTWVRLYLPVLR